MPLSAPGVATGSVTSRDDEDRRTDYRSGFEEEWERMDVDQAGGSSGQGISESVTYEAKIPAGAELLKNEVPSMRDEDQKEKIPPKRENIQNEETDSLYQGLMTHSFTAPAAQTESVIVPDFSGDKKQFEHWIQQLQFYLTSTRLIHSSDDVLKQFLLSYLKPGSPPAIIISSERKGRSKGSHTPLTFFEEILLLRNIYEEEDKPLRALMRADQITWNGQANLLDKLYADVKFAWQSISPKADLRGIKAPGNVKDHSGKR